MKAAGRDIGSGAGPGAGFDFARLSLFPGRSGAMRTRDAGGETDSEFVTADGGGPGAGSGGAQPVPAAPTAPSTAPRCEVTSGPTYTPTGSIPAVVAGGRKSFPFSMAATFRNLSPTGVLAGCCQVRQYIKWDATFAAHYGPPHSGFPSGSPADTWIEDRDTAGKRYGHRSGPFSDPAAGRDEYLTSGARDQLYGDTYVGTDAPEGPASAVGNWYFRLDVIDTCNSDAVKASSSIITVHWG